MQCTICEHNCDLAEDGSGLCRMYTNQGGFLKERYPNTYLVVVPTVIEAMPMLHYHPGHKFLQLCTIGCNFRCSGCVSWVLTESPETIEGATTPISPEKLIERAKNERCRGIMFSFNEPAVSLPTLKTIAKLAKRENLLFGCATNGYFTETSFAELLDHIDFINIGIKGCSDVTYRQLGAKSAAPVMRNLERAVARGICTEVAAVYMKGKEKEVLETAKRVAGISKAIPFQVMRFIPLGAADTTLEPSIYEAELLCEKLKKSLNYVYLFNSPGTSFLHTVCPECGNMLVRRGFNGPMCAHLQEVEREVCDCGAPRPFVGDFAWANDTQVLGFFGGYKTIHSLESIQTILAFLRQREPSVISQVFREILKTDFIKGLYERTKTIPSYLETVEYLAGLADRRAEAAELRFFIEHYVDFVEQGVAKVAKRPAVYYAISHPLIAVFGDKFECNLVETAGGRCLNKELKRNNSPGIPLPAATLNALDPDIIMQNNAISSSLSEFSDRCRECGIQVKAFRNRKIFSTHPYPVAGRPDWILGLLRIANILHPEIFTFDLRTIADDFYQRFLGLTMSGQTHYRSIAHPSLLAQRQIVNTVRE